MRLMLPQGKPLGGNSFAVPSRIAKWQGRAYAAAQIVALFILSAGLFVAIGVCRNPRLPLLLGSVTGASAIALAVGLLYDVGKGIVEARLDDDGIVFRTAWGRTTRIAYSRIMSVDHKKKILSIIRVRPPAQVVSIVEKSRWCFFLSPVSFTLSEEELPRLLAALRERVLRATGEDIDKGPATAQAQAASRKHPAEKSGIVPVMCLFLFVLMGISFEINNHYERYLHEQRLYAQGLRVAAVVDAVHREETTSLFLPGPDPDYDFTFEYSYRLPDGGRRSGTAHLPREWLGGFGVGDSVEVVYLPDWPSDSRLADGEASAGLLIVLVVLVALLLVVLVVACWACSAARVEAAEPEGWQRRSRRWMEIVRSLILGGMFVWICEPPVGEFVELVRLVRHGEVVSGRIVARKDEGRVNGFAFSYFAGGREWVGKRAYPYHIGSRYQPGDGVRVYVLPDDARVVQFADAVERNLWLRYGPTLLFCVVTGIALLVNLVLLLRPSRRVFPEHPLHPQA